MGLLRKKEHSSPSFEHDFEYYRGSSCKTTYDSTDYILDYENERLSSSEDSVSDVSSDDNVDINLGSSEVSLGAFLSTN